MFEESLRSSRGGEDTVGYSFWSSEGRSGAGGDVNMGVVIMEVDEITSAKIRK